MSDLYGIVLAAGAGRRMGGPKALLSIAGTTLVEQHVARLAQVGCRVIAVLVPPVASARVAKLLQGEPAARVEAVTTHSQAESLAAGLALLDRAGSTQHDVVVITPVDMLPARAATLRALSTSLSEDLLAVTPRYRGQGGHPVFARRALLSPYSWPTSQPLPPLRDLLAEAASARLRVDVDDPRVLGDLDTPEDAQRYGLRF